MATSALLASAGCRPRRAHQLGYAVLFILACIITAGVDAKGGRGGGRSGSRYSGSYHGSSGGGYGGGGMPLWAIILLIAVVCMGLLCMLIRCVARDSADDLVQSEEERQRLAAKAGVPVGLEGPYKQSGFTPQPYGPPAPVAADTFPSYPQMSATEYNNYPDTAPLPPPPPYPASDGAYSNMGADMRSESGFLAGDSGNSTYPSSEPPPSYGATTATQLPYPLAPPAWSS